MTDLMGCLGCDATYEVGAAQCPQCETRSPMYQSTKGDGGMPTITSGGASNAWEASDSAEDDASVAAAPVPADAEAVTVVGEPGPELVEMPVDAAAVKPATAKKALKKAAAAEPASEPAPAIEPEA